MPSPLQLDTWLVFWVACLVVSFMSGTVWIWQLAL